MSETTARGWLSEPTEEPKLLTQTAAETASAETQAALSRQMVCATRVDTHEANPKCWFFAQRWAEFRQELHFLTLSLKLSLCISLIFQ